MVLPVTSVIWGVDDATHELVGTAFRPLSQTVGGGQLLPIWLKQVLSANTMYEFAETHHDGKRFVILPVWASVQQPATYQGVPYIREGSSTTRLESGSAREAELWRRLQNRDFERLPARQDVKAEELRNFLDVDVYYDALGMPYPQANDQVLRDLVEQDLICQQGNGRYTITNLGALLISRRLSAFPGLRKRQLRVIRFEGRARTDIIEDRFFDMGYVRALPDAEAYIMSVTPAHEEPDGMFRRVRAFPRAAVRELLSNIAIHQDLANTMQYPEVHIFSHRIEFTNPGVSLIPVERLLNALPKTRNGLLVNALRLMDICAEEGTGWDVVIEACEEAHLRSPEVRTDELDGTVVTLFDVDGFGGMTKRQRKEAVYWHACLCYARRDAMSNQSVRERFGLDDSRASRLAVSRLIRECCEEGLIREEDPTVGTRYRRYIPAWA